MIPISVNNAKDELVKRLIKSGEDVLYSHVLNNGRYYLIKTNKRYILMKYTREPYHKADGGRSESINKDSLKRIMSLKAMGNRASIIVVYGDTGDIWETEPESFLLFGYEKADELDNDRYILNWKEDVWTVWKNESNTLSH